MDRERDWGAWDWTRYPMLSWLRWSCELEPEMQMRSRYLKACWLMWEGLAVSLNFRWMSSLLAEGWGLPSLLRFSPLENWGVVSHRVAWIEAT